MGKRLLFGWILAVALLLCACAATKPGNTSAPEQEDSYEETQEDEETPGDEETTPTTLNVPEPTEEETETTAPLHSELYLPAYSNQQILEYFQEVVLDVEYSDGTGDASLVQKWDMPIYYRIYGTPTEEDLAVLSAFFEQLNAVPGFPGIYPAEEDGYENLTIGFWGEEDFDAEFSAMLNGEYAYGAVQFWYYTDTNDIYTARIGYRTDIDQSTRNSVLIEEIVNMLGISDTVLREDSIVYQYSDDNLALSEVDWVILKLLYDPAIRCGMDLNSCAAVIQELYY